MQVRTLRAGEEEALLALLDPWDVGDGWRGRDFFRRYLERDPSYAPANVWVAEAAGRLVSCVQIFPRRLRVRGQAVPAGGIGSVYTAEDRRGEGIGGRVLARSVDAMTERGFELALLFAGPVAWYEERGWHSWPCRRGWLGVEVTGRHQPPASQPAAGVSLARFDAARDLADAMELHECFDAERDGSVIRDAAAWRASLELAGNPDEDFVVARRGEGLIAYARAIVLQSFPVLSETACAPGEERVLADLVVGLIGKRPEAPGMLASSPLRDAALHEALAARGVTTREIPDPTPMLRCLAAPALSRRLGEALAPAESPQAFLARVLPPERFGFWPADRF